MVKLTSSFLEGLRKSNDLSSGHLLLNAADEIIYANEQARHFLGLLADETLPAGQTFLSLVQSAYRCYPASAWLDWPRRSPATARYLIFSTNRRAFYSLLKVEVVEYLVVNGSEIWAIAMDLVESRQETAVIHSAWC